MENKFLKIEDNRDWQGLLDRALFKTFFHSFEWESFLEENFPWLKFERYIWKDQAVLSLARVKINGKEKLVSHPFCEYGGPLPLAENIDGAEFKKDVLWQFKTPLKISFHPELLKYFKGIGFPENQREAFFLSGIDEKSSDQLWQKLDRNRHRSIKKALEQNFQESQCTDPEDLKKLYNLYVKDLRRHKALVYPFSFFEFFLKSPQVRISLLKTQKGRLVGGNIFVMYGKIVHSFLCGFSGKYKDSGSHSLILWQEIENSRKEKYKMFDFGATKKGSTIGDFKTRWGAEVLPIYELKNYTGESKLKKSFLRNIWAWLPSFAVKFLSRHLIKYKL